MDSDDRERIEECRDELSRLLCEDELKDCCLLVMANKQDLPNAMSLQEVTEKLDLNKLPPSQAWRKLLLLCSLFCLCGIFLFNNQCKHAHAIYMSDDITIVSVWRIDQVTVCVCRLIL